MSLRGKIPNCLIGYFDCFLTDSSRDLLARSLPLSVSDEKLNQSVSKTVSLSSREASIENLQANPSFAEILQKYDLLPEKKVQESRSLDNSNSKSKPVTSMSLPPRTVGKQGKENPDRIEAWKLKDTKSSTWKAEINNRLEAAHKAAGVPMRTSQPEEMPVKFVDDRQTPDIPFDREEEKNSCIQCVSKIAVKYTI